MVDHVILHFNKKLRIVRKNLHPELFRELVTTYKQFVKPDKKFLMWPTEYSGIVTQAFGIHPEWYSPLPGHEGIDMKAPENSNIFAAFDGVVTRVDKILQHPAYGWHIRLENVFRGLHHEFAYAHLIEPSKLEIGDKVSAGEIVGLADSTGNSTGSHLHFMLKQEKDGLEAIQHTAEGWPTASNGFTIIDPTPYFEELI